MLAVANMEETIVFYKSVLGFTPTRNSPEYRCGTRRQTIHFMKAASEEVMSCAGIRDITSRFVVSVMWSTLKRSRIATEQKSFEREYGMTEFISKIPTNAWYCWRADIQ